MSRIISIFLVCLLFSSTAFSLGIRAPYRIAMSGDELFVTDPSLKQVVVRDSTSLATVRGFGINGGSYPFSVAVIPQTDGTKWVVAGNSTTRKVEVYDETGSFQYNFGSMSWAIDIAVDVDEDRVFVVNGDRRTVEAYSIAGTFVNYVPDSPYGRSPRYLYSPRGIAVDPLNKVLVISDEGNPRYGRSRVRPRIQTFTYEGYMLRSFMVETVMPRPLRAYPQPDGVATDTDGNVYVTDTAAGIVWGFNRISGAKLPPIVHPTLRYPMDIVLDPDTRDLFVLTVYGYGDKLVAIRGGAVVP